MQAECWCCGKTYTATKDGRFPIHKPRFRWAMINDACAGSGTMVNPKSLYPTKG